jgi:hypothetical protein
MRFRVFMAMKVEAVSFGLQHSTVMYTVTNILEEIATLIIYPETRSSRLLRCHSPEDHN